MLAVAGYRTQLNQCNVRVTPKENSSIKLLRLAGNDGSLSPEGGIVQLRLRANDHLALPGKVEVSHAGSKEDLADKLARGVEDVNSVSAAGVDVALGIAVNS